MSVFVGAKAYRSTAYTQGAGTGAELPWNAEDFDSDGFHDNATNPSRFTVPADKGGKYVFGGGWASSNNIGDGRNIYLHTRKNGALVKGGYLQMNVENGLSTTQNASLTVMNVMDLAAGDYAELRFDAPGDHGADMNTALTAAWIYRTPDPAAPLVGVSVKRSAALSSTSSAWTAMPFDAEDFDTSGFHDNATNNTRLTVPTGKAGYYHVGAAFSLNGTSPDNTRILGRINKNGSNIRGAAYEVRQSGNTGFVYPGSWCSALVYLAEGDYVESMYWIDGAYAFETGATCAMWMMQVGT